MKNKLLQVCSLALIFGFSHFFSEKTGFAANPGDSKIVAGPLGMNWSSLGPNNVAGRVRAAFFDVRDTKGTTIYAGSVTGGIWKSINSGLTWNPVNSGVGDVPKVTCMVQDASGTIYAGTGESFCTANFTGLQDYNYTTGLMGSGIWYSEDGNQFNMMAGTQPVTGDITSDWAFINKLALDSRNGRLYAATNTGLKYKDTGGSWTVAKSGNTIEVVVGADGTVLTEIDELCYMAPGGDVGNLVNLSTGTATGLPNADVGRVTFAIAPSDQNIIYASIASMTAGSLLNVYASYDKGLTWSVIFPGNNPPPSQGPPFDPFIDQLKNGTGCYDMAVAVFPGNPYHVMVGGQDMWYGAKIQSTGYYYWEQLSFGNYPTTFPLYMPTAHHSYMFCPTDSLKMVIGTDGGVTIGSLTKGFKTENRNLKISQFTSVGFTYAKDIVVGGAQNFGTLLLDGSLNSPDQAKQIWNGTGGNATLSLIDPNMVIYTQNIINVPAAMIPFRLSEDRGATYSLKFPGASINNTMNYVDPIYYWESFDFAQTRDSITYYAKEAAVEAGQSVLVYSPNAKVPYYHTVTSPIAKGDSLRIPDKIATRCFSFFTKNSTTGIWMSKDALKYTKDAEWFQVAKIPEAVTCIAGSTDMNYVWAGTKTGKIYRISNLALAYNFATADITSPTTIVAYELVKTFTGRPVTSISVSPEDNKEIVLTLGGYGYNDNVYLATNALDSVPTFINVQGNLPGVPAYASLIEMHDKSRVLIGTDYGIYSTDNILSNPPSWAPDNSGMGYVPVFMLKQQTVYQRHDFINDQGKIYNYPGVQNYGAIYAASYGSGLFIDTTYYNPMGIDPIHGTAIENGSVNIFPNPANDKVTLQFTQKYRGDITLIFYDISGRTVKTIQQNNVPSGDQAISVSITDIPAGTYIVRLITRESTAYGKLIKMN